jgi:hypothetical protein
MGLPPRAKLRNDFCVSVAGKASGGWVHQNFPFSAALKMDEVVGGAESFELSIGQGRIEDQAAGQFCFN